MFNFLYLKKLCAWSLQVRVRACAFHSSLAVPLSFYLASARTGVTLKHKACVVRQTKCHLACCLRVWEWACERILLSKHNSKAHVLLCWDRFQSLSTATIHHSSLHWLIHIDSYGVDCQNWQRYCIHLEIHSYILRWLDLVKPELPLLFLS